MFGFASSSVLAPLLDGLVPTVSIAVAGAVLRIMSKRSDKRERSNAAAKASREKERVDFEKLTEAVEEKADKKEVEELRGDVRRMMRFWFGEPATRFMPETKGFVDEVREWHNTFADGLTELTNVVGRELGHVASAVNRSAAISQPDLHELEGIRERLQHRPDETETP